MPRIISNIRSYGEGMSIKGIIFDFDGTLFDSMSIWETVGSDYLRSLGYAPENDLHKILSTMSLLQAAEYLKGRYALLLTSEEIMDGINKTVEDFYFHRAMPKYNVVNVLTYLKARGIKMCIATATDRYQIETALKRVDMLHFFDAIFTCTEVGHGKDEPYIFELARDSMGTDKSETAVFEDAYHTAKTAKVAGFYVIGVYDRYEKRTEELRELADVYINNFSEFNI